MIRGGRIEGGEKKDEGNENARWMHVAGAVLRPLWGQSGAFSFIFTDTTEIRCGINAEVGKKE